MKKMSDSRTEEIHKEVRMDILTGRIPGGTRLAESTLADEKGVSRTPVREALRQLVKEELLYAIPRAGYVVQELSERDIMDLFETRESIEMVAAQTALKKISEAELLSLEKNLLSSKEAIDKGTLEKMIDLDIQFHNIIYQATRSKYLYRICVSLNDYTLKFRKSVIIIPDIAARARRDHVEIYNAFKLKDSVKVEAAIRSHLKVVKQDVIEYLAKLRETSFLTGS